MKSKRIFVLAIALHLLVAGLAVGDITLDVYPSSAPNAYGSPSWGPYMANALNSLENGLGDVGDRSTDPTAYEIAGPVIRAGDIAVTSFNSWRGQVSPPAPFASELGNRLHFGLHAYGDVTSQFSLSQLTYAIHSSEPGDSLVYTGNFAGLSYTGTSRYGINWGADRVKGGVDDIVYMSGNGTTLVDELVYVGVGNGWWPGGDDPNPADPAGGAQAAMDDYFNWVGAYQPIAVTGSYTIQSFTGSASVDVVVPVPGALLLGGLGVGLVGWLRNRKVC